MKKAKITKSKAEIYKIRFGNGLYWANITVDDLGESGRIQIASDFGSWQNYWASCGCSFKKFLTELNIHYTANKFKADNWFDNEKTIERFKSDIIEYRMFSGLGKEKARELFDSLEAFEDVINKGEFIQEMWNSPILSFYNHKPPLIETITPQFKKFWETAWAVFIEEINSELKVSLTSS